MSKGNLEGNGIPPEDHEALEDESEKRLTRGKFIAGAGVAGAGLALGSVPAMAKGWSPHSRNKALASGLAPGMIGDRSASRVASSSIATPRACATR